MVSICMASCAVFLGQSVVCLDGLDGGESSLAAHGGDYFAAKALPSAFEAVGWAFSSSFAPSVVPGRRNGYIDSFTA